MMNTKKRKALIIGLVAALMLASACSSAPPARATDPLNAFREQRSDGVQYPAQATSAPAAPNAGYWQDGAGQYYGRGETYRDIDESSEKRVETDPLLTFSLKVDTAAYTNVVRYLESDQLPPADAVRIEELINYFNYDAMPSFGSDPFAILTEVGPSPMDPRKALAMVRVKAREIDKEALPASNLTFLIDSSGSMESYDKLPLLKDAFGLLVDTLGEGDTVSIVTYAGSSAVVLDSVSAVDKDAVMDAIHSLSAGGSTAGANGILTAYALAERNFIPGGNNRIILATDGDFNVGVTDIEELNRLVAEKRGNGVYLSVLGFGTGNIRDDIMETLSQNGNGNYSYINSVATARKVLVEELSSNLYAIADDVKAQVEFNPANVAGYRLIGYENRMLENRDFADDRKDAGEIGVGTDVVILFELELREGVGVPTGQDLKYGGQQAVPVFTGSGEGAYPDELFEVRIRYKQPGAATSNLMLRPVALSDITDANTSDYRFAASVAAFGHLLRGSPYAGDASIEKVIALAEGSLGADEGRYRAAHLETLRRYRYMTRR